MCSESALSIMSSAQRHNKMSLAKKYIKVIQIVPMFPNKDVEKEITSTLICKINGKTIFNQKLPGLYYNVVYAIVLNLVSQLVVSMTFKLNLMGSNLNCSTSNKKPSERSF